MTHQITVRDSSAIAITPADVVEQATIQAKLLMDIVEKTGCYQDINGKKYLQVEAWETIGAFNRTVAAADSTTPILRDAEVVGYLATVSLLKDGLVVGRASMPCFFTENACKGKEGDAKHKAAMSAAQTFATSKVYRMNFSYVAILAGYQPTPAEEMSSETHVDKPEQSDKRSHYCLVHKTKFFKSVNMTSYAHPVEGQKEWCHEHKDKPTAPVPEAHPVKAGEATGGIEASTGTPPSPEPVKGNQSGMTEEEMLSLWDNEPKAKPTQQASVSPGPAPTTLNELWAWCKESKITVKRVCEVAGVKSVTEITPGMIPELYKKLGIRGR